MKLIFDELTCALDILEEFKDECVEDETREFLCGLEFGFRYVQRRISNVISSMKMK